MPRAARGGKEAGAQDLRGTVGRALPRATLRAAGWARRSLARRLRAADLRGRVVLITRGSRGPGLVPATLVHGADAVGGALALVNHLVPTAAGTPEEQEHRTGKQSETPLMRSPLTGLTRRNNEPVLPAGATGAWE